MGLGLLAKIKRAVTPTVVRVAFRDLTAPAPELGDAGWYAYLWTLPGQPVQGLRVIVPGADGPAPAVIVGVGTMADLAGHDAKSVSRLATASEVRAAEATAARDLAGWLDMARRAAGLPVAGRARKTPPGRYPTLPPAKGDATPEQAGEYGRVWFRAYKCAEEAGRDPEEVRAFRSIAHRWYAIRDRGPKT